MIAISVLRNTTVNKTIDYYMPKYQNDLYILSLGML